MDFLDPKKQRAHMIRIIAGYVLIGVAVLITTLILLYQAYGFGLGKDGEVIQNGFVFMSSQPDSAQIFLDGKLYKSRTSSKLQLPAGQYKAELKRDGYGTWQRLITVDGGSLQRFDYPKLFPTKITTTSVKSYAEAPGFASASPNHRWLLVQQGSAALSFDLFDTADPKKLATSVVPVTLPEAIVTNAKNDAHAWKLVEWSTDNRRVLLQHTYSTTLAGATVDTSEYILVDRQVPAESVNLTRTLALAGGKQLSLHDKKFDKYYVFDPTTQTLGTTSIEEAGAVTPLLEHVLAYKSFGAGSVLYMSDHDPVTDVAVTGGKVESLLLDDGQTYKLREHGAAGPYLLDLVQYNGDWFVAAGSSGDSKVYVYQDPQRIRKASSTAVLVPVQIMRVAAANHVQFSSNSQHVIVENGAQFADYDVQNNKGYKFTSSYGLDAPATNANWMDGYHLTYVSGGKLVVYDYDNINADSLVPASADYLPFFDAKYRTVYAFAPVTVSGVTTMTLTSSSLLTPADQ